MIDHHTNQHDYDNMISITAASLRHGNEAVQPLTTTTMKPNDDHEHEVKKEYQKVEKTPGARCPPFA